MSDNSAAGLYQFYRVLAQNPPSYAKQCFAEFWVNASEEEREDAKVAAIKIKERLEREKRR